MVSALKEDQQYSKHHSADTTIKTTDSMVDSAIASRQEAQKLTKRLVRDDGFSVGRGRKILKKCHACPRLSFPLYLSEGWNLVELLVCCGCVGYGLFPRSYYFIICSVKRLRAFHCCCCFLLRCRCFHPFCYFCRKSIKIEFEIWCRLL